MGATNDSSGMLVKLKEPLDEYKEIMSKELPEGLTPMRSISHHIDLIVGESLPNKVAYKFFILSFVLLNKSKSPYKILFESLSF